MRPKPLIVLSSVIANKPLNGGNARMVLNWLEGLERLGADVFLIEQLASETCVDDAGGPTVAGESANRRYFESVLQAHRFGDRAALVCDAGDTLAGATIHGSTAAELDDLARDADLLINISGHLSVPSLRQRFRRKAYIDLDPGYTQFWHAGSAGAARLEDHDVYFTVGQRIGTSDCTIPTGGIGWKPMRQPIVLDDCMVTQPTSVDRFTTIASWRGAFAPVTHEGETYRVKAHEFRKIVELPRVSDYSFEAALDIHPGDSRDLNDLRAAGWDVVDPREVADTPRRYCTYIDESAAECSAAQGMYVQTRSGWFSDRTARYLAAGKPVLVQDTGFTVPGSGEGLLVFATLTDAAAGADRIACDYRAHSEAARFLAERYFDSTTELGRLLEQAGV